MQSGRRRLRPVLMTSLTTFLGLLPLAYGVGAGADMLRPMAIAVIGSLFMSLMLSLVATPVSIICGSALSSPTRSAAVNANGNAKRDSHFGDGIITMKPEIRNRSSHAAICVCAGLAFALAMLGCSQNNPRAITRFRYRERTRVSVEVTDAKVILAPQARVGGDNHRHSRTHGRRLTAIGGWVNKLMSSKVKLFVLVTH